MSLLYERILMRLIREGMRVPSRLGQSEIHGTGVFAVRKINPGEAVFVWDPESDRVYERDDIPDSCIDLASWDGTVWHLAGDDGAFFNHSSDPNVRVSRLSQSHPAASPRIASRHISPGEEMTMDYAEIGLDIPRVKG